MSAFRIQNTLLAIACASSALLAFTISVHAQAPASGIEQALNGEINRQRRVAGSLKDSIDTMQELISDLRSNKMHEDPAAMSLGSLHRLLDDLAEQNVMRSGELLRHARLDPDQRGASLAGAETEVDVVIQRLREVIDEAGLERKKRIYNALLQEIIEDQWSVLRDTIQWGRAMVTEVDKARDDSEGLRQSQQIAGDKFGSFIAELRKGIMEEEDKTMQGLLEDVVAALQVRRVGAHQRNATGAITELDPGDAAEEQQAALHGLQDARDILNGVDWQELQQLVLEAELKEKIREIVEAQKTLRLDVIREPAGDDTQNLQSYSPAQTELKDRLAQLEPDVEKLPSKAILAPAVKRAGVAMLSAGDALTRGQQKNATDQQLRAITLLEDALEAFAVDEMSAIARRPIPLGLGEFGMLYEGTDGFSIPPGAGLGMGPGIGIGLSMGGAGGASVPGSGGWGPPGAASTAEAGFGAGEGPGEAGMGEAGMGEGGMGEGGMGEGGPGEGVAMGMDASGVPDMSPDGGTGHRWGSDDVAEDPSLRGGGSAGHLGAIARQQIQQLYERELPPMYRGMIQDYFEVLAAEER